MVFMGGHHGRSHCCPKNHCCTSEVFIKSTWMFLSATGKLFCGQITKVVLFGRNTQHYVWRKKSIAHQHQNLLPTVKYSGGRLMVWGCFAASGPGQLYIITGQINSQVFQDILQNVRQSVRQLKLNRSSVMQQDNGPKHRSKSTTEWLE